MRTPALIVTALSAALLALSPAQAASVSLSDSAAQTVDGQVFNFNLGPAPLSDGQNGVFTIQARGDYGLGTATEFLTWSLEALVGPTQSGPVIGGATIIENLGINEVEWRQSFVISGADLLALSADGSIDVLVDLNDVGASGVNVGLSSNEFVSVTLDYTTSATAVPEPGSLALAGLALAGLAASRRRQA